MRPRPTPPSGSGLDGDGSDTVEQIGTEGYSEGAVGYDAWYELYPAAPVTLGMTIRPGDLLTATVTESGGATFTWRSSITRAVSRSRRHRR